MPVPPGSLRRALTSGIAEPAEQSTPRYWKSQVHVSPRIARGFQNSLRVWLCNETMHDAGRSNLKPINQMYVALDKEKPGIGSIRSVDLTAVS
jgi:hypothetical protein